MKGNFGSWLAIEKVEVFKPQIAHLHHLTVRYVCVEYDGFPRVAPGMIAVRYQAYCS